MNYMNTFTVKKGFSAPALSNNSMHQEIFTERVDCTRLAESTSLASAPADVAV